MYIYIYVNIYIYIYTMYIYIKVIQYIYMCVCVSHTHTCCIHQGAWSFNGCGTYECVHELYRDQQEEKGTYYL